MILQTMNSLQVLHHFSKDVSYFSNAIVEYGNKLERLVRKQPRIEIFKHKCYFRKETNQKYIVFFSKQMYESKIYIITVAEVRVSPTKFNYYIDGSCYGDSVGIKIVTDHFLDQYRKRISLECSKVDALYNYIRESRLAFEIYNCRKTNHSVWAFRDGLALCKIEDFGKVTVLCTFVGFNEMKPSQLASFKKVVMFFDSAYYNEKAEGYLRDIMKGNEYTKYKYSADEFSINQSVANDLYSDYFKEHIARDECDYSVEKEFAKCKSIDVSTLCRNRILNDVSNNGNEVDLLESLSKASLRTISLLTK